MGIKEDILNKLKNKNFTEEQINQYFFLIKYVYIGQNIRNEGILQSDENLKKNVEIIEILLKDGILTVQKWYNLDLFLLTNLGIQLGEILIYEEIKKEKKAIKKELEDFPQLLVGFLINHYISESLAFDLEEEYIFDWRYLILKNKRIKGYIRKFFDLLKQSGLAVITEDYVSTKGGKQIGKRFVICSEIRKFLQNLYLINGLSYSDLIECKVAYILQEKIEYSQREFVCFVSEEELRKTGNFDSAHAFIKNELDRYKREGLIKNLIYTLGGNVTFFIVKKDKIKEKVSYLYSEKIDKLLKIDALFEEESREELNPEEDIQNNKKIVSELIENKVKLYRLIAQLSHGKSMFKSNPNTELFGLKLIDTICDEDELRNFIINLHQLVIESSANQILRFIENNDFWKSKKEEDNKISPKEFIDFVEETDEYKIKLFEDARDILNNLHNLRNHYSHLQDSKKFYESNIIFKKLINMSFPTTEKEFTETQAVLLERTKDALDNLCDIFTNVICKRKSDMSIKGVPS